MVKQVEVYGIALMIRPTGALTFRRIPSAILHISSYPFLPPSTMSGWLRRLFLLRSGIYPETTVKNPDYFVMPEGYHALGAYPWPDPKRSYQMHTTKRHGVRAFNHNAFSRLVGHRTNKEVYQLHDWEYLLVEQLCGFVLHRDPAALEKIYTLHNFGCKCGKEGYAYLESVSEVRVYERKSAVASPAVPATGQELMGKPADLFMTYRHQHSANEITSDEPDTSAPSNVSGFVATWLGWPGDDVEMEYLTDGENYIPAGMVEVF